MRLERLFAHRLIRVLRIVLPVVVIILIAIPAWNYREKIRSKPAARDLPKALPKGSSVKTENFNLSKTEGNRVIYTIKAKENLGLSEGRNMLQDVDVIIYGDKEGDPPRLLKSRNCSYEEKTDYIVCSGNVEVQLDANTIAKTEEIAYTHNERRLVTNAPTSFERAKSMNGSAGRVEYTMNDGLLRLTGGVDIHSVNGLDLKSGAAEFQDKQNWATASSGVVITTKTGWIRGGRARAELSAQTHEPKTILVEENVVSESRSKDGATWNLQAGSIRTSMSEKGYAEKLVASANVVLRKTAREGNLQLSGGEVEAHMSAGGDVELVEGRQSPALKFADDRSLTATRIWSTASGVVSTDGPSVLQVGASRVTGSKFFIENGDVVRFSTPERATLTMDGRETAANTTEARFDSRTNQLVSLTQKGKFTFRQGEQRGSADSAEQTAAKSVTLRGSAMVSDAKMRLDAAVIELNEETKTQTASGDVRTTSTESGERIVVLADKVSRLENLITYTGKVRLFRGDVSIESDSLEVPVGARVFKGTSVGHVVSRSNNITVWADRLEYDDQSRLAHYSGNVRAQKKDLRFTAADMVMKTKEKQNAVSEITATGNVVMSRGEGRGTGERAVYDGNTQLVVLTGSNAEVNTGEGAATKGPRITVNVSGAKMAVVEGAGTQRAVTKYKVPPA